MCITYRYQALVAPNLIELIVKKWGFNEATALWRALGPGVG